MRKRHKTISFNLAVAVLTLAGHLCLLCRSLAAQAGSALPVPRSLPTENEDTSRLPDAPTLAGDDATVRGLPYRVLKDEVHFVQFPRWIGKGDAAWLIPLAGAAVAAFATDEKTMAEIVSSDPSFNQKSGTISDGLRYGFVAVPVGLLAFGQVTHNDHARETGVLGSEAMLDAYIAGDLVKLATFRERPYVDRSEGSFYRLSAGTDSSFISGHSLVAWSSAAVLAAEYPGRWRQASIYTLAAGVSLTRVLAQQHFPSDVLLGSTAGWLIGHYVVHAHRRNRPPHK